MGELLHGLFMHFGASSGACADQTFLGLYPWYHYLNFSMQNGACQDPNFQFLGAKSDILLILLAIVDDLLRIVGLLAVIFVILSGVKYIMSRGEPGEIAKAQSGIINSLAGLAIALISIKFVSYLGGRFDNATGGSSSQTGLDLTTLPNPTGIANGAIVPTLLTVIFMIAGALSLLFLILGGYGYVSSRGDPQAVAKAKGTIMYALIGLVVTVLAESIVSWVTGKI